MEDGDIVLAGVSGGADSDVSGTAYADEPQSLIHGSDKGENLCLHGRAGRLLS